MKNTKEAAYSIDDYIVYKQDGICKITDIKSENIGGTGEKLYYIIRPVYNENTQIYVPVDLEDIENRMKPVLSAEEINNIITLSEKENTKWIDDSKIRFSNYLNIINNGKREEVLTVLKVLSLHKTEVEEKGKKFYSSDERLLEIAQKKIMEEFAFVLDIEKSDVIPYILEQIEKTK